MNLDKDTIYKWKKLTSQHKYIEVRKEIAKFFKIGGIYSFFLMQEALYNHTKVMMPNEVTSCDYQTKLLLSQIESKFGKEIVSKVIDCLF